MLSVMRPSSCLRSALLRKHTALVSSYLFKRCCVVGVGGSVMLSATAVFLVSSLVLVLLTVA